MKRVRSVIAVALAGGICLSVGGVRAEEEQFPARPTVAEVAKFNDSVLDAALARLCRTTEVAVVQVSKFKELAEKKAKEEHPGRQKAQLEVQKLQASLDEARKNSPDAAEAKALADRLAAKKQELAEIQFNEREQLFCDILGILYPDQAGAFQDSYEDSLDPAVGVPRKKARDRMRIIFSGRIELTADQRKEITMALMKQYASTMAAEAALEASYKVRLAERGVTEEYRQKREALLNPIRAKTLEIAKSLLPADKQKEVDLEWTRRQERRIAKTLKEQDYEFSSKVPEQQAKLSAVKTAFHDAAKGLDLDTPDYDVLVEKLRVDLGAVMNK